MKQQLSTPFLTAILLISSGVVFPIIFTMTDKLLRTILIDMNTLVLMVSSFSWLLIFYFYGIKFSLEYITRQFEIEDTQKLFNYSNIGFTLISISFYSSLISSSMLSNFLWGCFYLFVIGFFYYLSSKELSH
ncbi:hypothetical protein JHD50_07740 [Sulfurimonas sp. MAG313]|nr:hypothetical protein [Sulfurimonas sp. MAG313]MDF1881194.1 hypothetical protein [Sulfurimonas sp. MAG313]